MSNKVLLINKPSAKLLELVERLQQKKEIDKKTLVDDRNKYFQCSK
jgi:hypothetical protein